MEPEEDNIYENLIEQLRPRLRELIEVEQVLDHIHLIKADQKDQIRQKERTEGNPMAANLLISTVIKKPHEPGWFQAFVDALIQAGCGHAADYMQGKLPEPEVEAENDYCVQLIQILSPSLVDMNTAQVCLHCHASKLLTQEDSDIVSRPTYSCETTSLHS